MTTRPMRWKQRITFIGLFFTITAITPLSQGQEFYSYLDETGVQVFTNIPPANSERLENYTGPTQNNSQKLLSSPDTTEHDSHKFDPIIKKYASYYELDPSLIHSIIATESGFNPKAVSSKGARGLMQLMPETAKRLGVSNSFDPEQNIRAGVQHFRSLMDTFNNNLDLSLAAYNAGESLVQRLGRIPGYEETINYVRSVTRRYVERRESMEENPVESRTYRYVDPKGVLHLTNIPPPE